MITIGHILCPVDFSAYSRHALDHALAMGEWCGASVTLLHVVQGSETPDAQRFVPVASASDQDHAARELASLAATASAAEVPVFPLVRTGAPVAEILRCADEIAADLIVLRSHGRAGFERLLLGSVAEKVLREARCPVLVVPGQITDRWSRFPRILCPVDFSDSSLRAVEYALSIAQESDAHLTLLHVVEHEPAEPEVLLAIDSSIGIPAFRRQQEEDLHRRLTQLIPSSLDGICTVDVSVVRGKPWRQIVQTCEGQTCDLIVMGVEGRGPVDLVVFGSTTQQVVRQAGCPVLTLRR